MKRYVAFLLAVCMILSVAALAGCPDPRKLDQKLTFGGFLCQSIVMNLRSSW